MRQQVCIEKGRYVDEVAARAAVRDIWKDRPVIIESESAHEWIVRVQSGWPMTPFPDEKAEEVALQMFGLDVPKISSFRRGERWGETRFYLLSLSHAWALWAWSHALRSPAEEPLTLIHLDAHADLEIPSLVCTGERWRFDAPVGRDHLDLREPGSIATCIEEGFIGIGSFIVPLLYANHRCHFVSVEPDPIPRGPRLAYLSPRWVPHHSLVGLHDRPAAIADREGSQSYLRIGNLDDLARLKPTGSVLLDIDMDYFCNPFEESEHSRERPLGHSWTDIESVIDGVLDVLQDAPWRSLVRVITVALSPGFFPSEYWSRALPRMEAGLRQAYGG